MSSQISDDILNETLRVLRDKFNRTTEWLQEAENHLREITKHVSPAERVEVAAVATHVRVGEMFATPLATGILVWAGLYLRDARLRALLPLRLPGAGTL